MTVPGPGTYPHNTLIGMNVSKTMSQKLCPAFEKPGANNNPGPGTYGDFYRTTIKKDPSYVIGTSTRND